jgi:hypothetical protein
MLRRASDLTARARARIRAAREHDPYGWDERLGDRAPLSHEDVYRAEPIDFVRVPDELADDDRGDRYHQLDRDQKDRHEQDGDSPDEAAGATRPPLGSPEPGAQDVDGVVGAGGISGPPQGGRPHRPAERSRRLMSGADRRSPPEDGVPNGCGRRPRGPGG